MLGSFRWDRDWSDHGVDRRVPNGEESVVSYFGGDLSGSFRLSLSLVLSFHFRLSSFADSFPLAFRFAFRASATRDDGRRRRQMLVHRYGGNVQTCSSAGCRGEVWVERGGGVG